MTYKHYFHKIQQGFSLIELAIVLFIVTLLLGGLLVPLTAQIDQQRSKETQKTLADLKEILIGYAIIYGSLPCPTTTLDPASLNYGISDATCPPVGATSDGYLPWKTLGVSEIDAWGSKRSNITDPVLGFWRYRVDRNFTTPFTLSTGFSVDKLSIADNNNNLITPPIAGCLNANPTSECPVAIIYSTGKNLTSDGKNTAFELTNATYQSDIAIPGFDDIVIWISRPQLFNRMVTAGKLP